MFLLTISMVDWAFKQEGKDPSGLEMSVLSFSYFYEVLTGQVRMSLVLVDTTKIHRLFPTSLLRTTNETSSRLCTYGDIGSDIGIHVDW